MKQHLVDKYHCLISPKLIGEGTPSLGNLGLAKMADAISFDRVSYQLSGPDMIFTGYPCWRDK
jgi:riboflavin biosynthesis pyrimidine reductase